MTTYFIRTFECIFPVDWHVNSDSTEDVYSNSKILKATLGGSYNAYMELLNPTVSGVQQFSRLGSPYAAAAPSKTAAGTVTLRNSYHNWREGIFNNDLGFSETVWVNQGWSNPGTSYMTWLNEIANQFNTAKVNDPDWGTDSGVINIYVFKYKYNNYPLSGWSHFPFFNKGNDPNAEIQIEV